ncbi:RHS repeat domain-containing protein [Montanilutibacter psychrotolerans]|nr:RHS repeat domain-containing protein [Lysobacter psychrotolerans]
MRRMARLDVAGVVQHVVQRGNDRQWCRLREVVHSSKNMTMKLFGGLSALFALSLPVPASAQIESRQPWDEYGKKIETAQAVGAVGPDLFGDSVNFSNGALSFSATDVSVPGNSKLPVAFTRVLSVSNWKGYQRNDSPLADWELDVPRISGVFGSRDSFGSACEATTPLQGRPPTKYVSGGIFNAQDYWSGNRADMPGGGELLLVNPNSPKPSRGGPYYWMTSEFTYFSCLPSVKNGDGPGFLAVARDGTKYWFDVLASYHEPGMDKVVSDTSQHSASSWTAVATLGRTRNVLYVSRVEDRFGNYVTYAYANAANQPARLMTIGASDGRQIDIGYNARGHVATVSSSGRTWTYEYRYPTSQLGSLTAVVQPDGSRWTFDLYALTHALIRYAKAPGDPSRSCGDPGDVITTGATGTITHPSGAVGEFRVDPRRHGRSNVPMVCSGYTAPYNNVSDDIAHYPLNYDTLSLTSKRISGPGLVAAEWNYGYSASIFFAPGTGPVCTSGSCMEPVCTSDACAGTARTWVWGPDNQLTRYTFGNSYRYNEGKLLKVESGTTTQPRVVTAPFTILRADTSTYELAQSAQPFQTPIGTSPQEKGAGFTSEYLRPRKLQSIVQDGATFTSHVTLFDAYANPLKATEDSSLGNPRNVVNTYHHNLGKWVVGQVASTSINGIVTSSTDFDAVTAMPLRQYAFGKLTHTLAHYGAGHLKSVTDGRDYTTTLSSWKRGVPQLIQHPDTTTESAVVNDDGTIASTTDENGFTTAYEYDPMGRLAKLTYPESDTVAWAPTTQVFEPVAVSEHGIPAGHWRQAVATGNYRKVSYFDGLWRPVLIREYDTANVTATSRFTAFGYDHDGRTTFASYPVASTSSVAAITQGVRSTYDALGRRTRTEQDNELGSAPLVTTTDYLAGFKTRTTNPRGKQVTTSYLAYGAPTTDWPVSIIKHANASTTINTDIARNTFGKPLAMTQRNDAGTITATRSYSYNAYQELCRTSEPEGGTTVFAYDAAGNLAWSAPGVPATTTCASSISDTAKISRGYDQRNRITAQTFPDNLGNTSYTYYPDGQPHTLVTDNGASNVVTTTYVYNKRRLLTGENLQWPGVNWNLGYGYSANGHLASQTYPDNTSVTYLPNALGQPTQASAYATGVSYYPNGSIKQFTYGNGIVHDLTQNLRGLAERSRDAYGGVAVHDDSYDYDANGNVAAISDGLPGAPGNRTMTYDNFDRLTGVTAPMFGGDGVASFGYDVLDNLLSAKVGNKSHVTYTHDATRNLLSTAHNSAGTVTDTLRYDARGNVSTRTNATYTFDRGNRLRSATSTGGAVSSYVYDGHGRRVRDIANGDSKYSQYNQAGQLMYASDLRLDLRTNYIHLGGSLVATRRLDPVSGAVATRYQHTDALGSPVVVTDPTRTVIERTRYAPYGARISGPASDGPGYTGHVQDTATGLTYMQQRYYDPSIGRFLSVDPVTTDRKTGANFNRYKYAGNNPYRFTDPDGRRDWDSLSAHSSNFTSAGSGLSISAAVRSPGPVGSARAGEGRLPPTASVRTEMKSQRTTFTVNGTIAGEWSSKNDVSKRALPGADSPYESSDSYPAGGPYKNNANAYGPNEILRTNDVRGRWIHGGGTGLPDPSSPAQGWKPTMGCTRMQNGDIQELVDLVRDFKSTFPGVSVPYSRVDD